MCPGKRDSPDQVVVKADFFSGSGIPCARSNEHGFVAMARELANIRSEKRNTS
jgi:hypothetical protein